jgi:chloramphenicol-sensitive protein RarD
VEGLRHWEAASVACLHDILLGLQAPGTQSNEHAKAGVMMAVGAYGWWAIITPLYYRAVEDVPLGELLAWRAISGLPALLLMLWAMKQLPAWWAALRTPRVLGLLAVSAVLISVNWIVFIWAVMDNRLSEASLGYYINPLVSVALGMLVLGERLRKTQWMAITLASVGVAVLAWRLGGLPWISLTLAGSFGLYGLVRKQVDAGPAVGLAVEMFLVLPFMFVLLWFDHVEHGNAVLAGPWLTSVLLLCGGVVTIAPLVLFAGCVKRLRLSTVGLLQYIAPSGQLILAVLVFNEPFGTDRMMAFLFIWAAVVVYSIDSIRHAKLMVISIPGEA